MGGAVRAAPRRYALRAAKEAIDRGLEVDLDTGLEIERQQFAALFATEDRAIGMQSFVEDGPGKRGSSAVDGREWDADRQGIPPDDEAELTWPRDMTDNETEQKPQARRRGGRQGQGRFDWVRLRLAQLVWLVCVVAALFLAVGALLIALGDSVNRDNDLVKFVLDTADKLDLGVFDLDDGVLQFHGKNAETKDALLNWGLAAVTWLIAGRILDRIIRP